MGHGLVWMQFPINWQSEFELIELILLLPLGLTSSIHICEPTPEAAMQAQAMTLPPLCFKKELVCFVS